MRILDGFLKEKESKIQLGDVFKAEDDMYYMLIQYEDDYILTNISQGYGTLEWNMYFEKLESTIRNNIRLGTLVHYPKDDHYLSLMRN